MTVTTASAALNELVQTMEVLAGLYDLLHRQQRDPTPQEDTRLSQLERRREALERQLQQIVTEQLGVDYGVLWHAVTPK